MINSAPGTIGLASAEQNGAIITFTFTQPICAGTAPGQGQSSFFFGLASTGALTVVTAKVEALGDAEIKVRAGAPTH